jgi:hypothetical protein
VLYHQESLQQFRAFFVFDCNGWLRVLPSCVSFVAVPSPRRPLWRLGHAGYEKRRVAKIGQGRRNATHHPTDLGQTIEFVDEIECDFCVIVSLAHHAPPAQNILRFQSYSKASETLSTVHCPQKCKHLHFQMNLFLPYSGAMRVYASDPTSR